MKKLLFFAAAALALVACNNDVTISENTALAGSNAQYEIGFLTLAHTPKHAPVVDGVFPTTDSMYVAAYDVTNSRDFFEATKFKYSGDGTIWKADPAKYWPLAVDTINFLAYANFQGTSATWAVAPATAKASGVTLVMTDNKTEQKDLMYAIGTGGVKQTGNALTFPENVPMAFKHAQAWISFNAKAKEEAYSNKIILDSIMLNGAKYSGTFTVTHTNYNATSGQNATGAWSVLPPAGDTVKVLGLAENTAVAYASSGNGQPVGGMLIVPDDGAGDDFNSFTIHYRLDGKAYTYTFTPDTRSIAQAQHFVYNIVFTLHEILISATVDPWDEDETAVPVG